MTQTPTATIRTGNHRLQLGMTLLELLIVIALMSAVGFMAMSQVGDDMSQARYQDTVNRLIALRRAILGYEEPVFNGQSLFSGYAADNGRLPLDEWGIKTLIAIDTVDGSLDAYGLKSPIFDPTPNPSTGYDNKSGDEADLTTPSLQLFKGWRGPYLIARPGDKGTYRDGWGNQDPDQGQDALSFGWLADLIDATDTPDATIYISSLGRDGLNDTIDASPETDYDDDIQIEIGANDWMVDTWQVYIHNGTDDDIVTGDDSSFQNRCLRLSLLVYRNQPANKTQGRWLRLTSTCVPGVGSANSCLDGTDASATIDDDMDSSTPELSCPSTQAVSFTTAKIPQGRHLLVLIVDDTKGALHDSGGNDAPCTSTNDCPSTNLTIKQIDFFARAGLPDVTLEIAP